MPDNTGYRSDIVKLIHFTPLRIDNCRLNCTDKGTQHTHTHTQAFICRHTTVVEALYTQIGAGGRGIRQRFEMNERMEMTIFL